jgi:Ni,Fe-hydrogenase maturation factor
MRTLLIACGNPLRRDDGAASEALRHLAQAPNRVLRSVRQLTPELAEEAARFDRVVFLDADAGAARVTIEHLGPGFGRGASLPRSPLTHFATPAEIVALSRGLFGFAGEALLCRIPARDFSLSANPGGADLSANTLRFARQAAAELENLP